MNHHNNKLVKLLVILSIAIPLSIVMAAVARDGKQRLVKFIQWRDYQLLEKVASAVKRIQGEIERNRLSAVIKSYYKKSKGTAKNPIEVYDKLVFNIYMLNVNRTGKPISRQRLLHIESLLTRHIKQHSYVKDIVQTNINSAHISQIEHNYQSKLIQLYSQSINSNSKASQYYIDSIIKQLKNSNKPKHCHYLVQNTQCKEHAIYVVYGDKEDGEGQGQYNSQLGQDQYWATQDHKQMLIVMPSFDAKSFEFINFLTTIDQLIYQALGMADLIQHVDKISTQSPLNDQDILSNEINRFIQLHQLHKQLNILKQIQQIVNNTEIPYTRITDEERQLLMNDLSKIVSSSRHNETIRSGLILQKSINHTTISMITRIDTFPTDYKLGALAPIAIILLYPLFNLIPNLKK